MRERLRDLFQRNYGDVYRFACRMTQSHEWAEDIAQEAFLRLAQNGATDLTGEAARRWLFVVARNLCITRLREQSRRREVGLAACPEPASVAATPAEGQAAREKAARVREAVAGLPPYLREVTLLREYENMTYAEIATVLGCSEGTVKSRLARARTALREQLLPLKEDLR